MNMFKSILGKLNFNHTSEPELTIPFTIGERLDMRLYSIKKSLNCTKKVFKIRIHNPFYLKD